MHGSTEVVDDVETVGSEFGSERSFEEDEETKTIGTGPYVSEPVIATCSSSTPLAWTFSV